MNKPTRWAVMTVSLAVSAAVGNAQQSPKGGSELGRILESFSTTSFDGIGDPLILATMGLGASVRAIKAAAVAPAASRKQTATTAVLPRVFADYLARHQDFALLRERFWTSGRLSEPLYHEETSEGVKLVWRESCEAREAGINPWSKERARCVIRLARYKRARSGAWAPAGEEALESELGGGSGFQDASALGSVIDFGGQMGKVSYQSMIGSVTGVAEILQK